MSTSEPERSLYDRDFYTWARRQAAALKRRDVEAIDWENVTEEIEALARADERALRDGYSKIIRSFLKLQYWENDDTNQLAECNGVVSKARSEIMILLEDSPGLEAERRRLYRSAWRWARELAIRELVQPAIAPIQDEEKWEREGKRLRQAWSELIPEKNPYTRRQVEDPDWLPAGIPLADRPRLQDPTITK